MNSTASASAVNNHSASSFDSSSLAPHSLSVSSSAMPSLAIIVKCWPRLSETFVAQELAALEERGQSFEIWSLRHPANQKRHPLHSQVGASVKYLPEYLHSEILRVACSWWKARQLPGFAEARRIFWSDFKRDATRNRLRRFGQACVLAAELPDSIRALYAHFIHTPSSVARYAAIMQELPWSYSAHAKDIWTSPEWEIREKLDPNTFGATFGVTCTASGAAHLQELSAESGRLDLVYHGLDVSRFPAPPQRIYDNSHMDTSATSATSQLAPVRLLSVGRLVEKKGFDNLIAALAKLPPELNWQWVHIGGGELNATLQAQAKQLQINSKISWLGECEQPEVVSAMRNADIFVLPSRIAADGDRDGLPNVLMEAASQKLPIISTAVSAIPEFVRHAKDGVLTSDTPVALAESILQLAQNPATREAYAESAYQRLLKEFGMHTGITQLELRLQELCRQS